MHSSDDQPVAFVTICWRLVRTFAVRLIKIFRGDLVSLHLPRRARKLNVDDLGDCGGDLRGARGVEGGLKTKSDGRQLPMGISPPATASSTEGYDISRLVLLAEAYTFGWLPDIKRMGLARRGVVLDPDIGYS